MSDGTEYERQNLHMGDPCEAVAFEKIEREGADDPITHATFEDRLVIDPSRKEDRIIPFEGSIADYVRRRSKAGDLRSMQPSVLLRGIFELQCVRDQCTHSMGKCLGIPRGHIVFTHHIDDEKGGLTIERMVVSLQCKHRIAVQHILIDEMQHAVKAGDLAYINIAVSHVEPAALQFLESRDFTKVPRHPELAADKEYLRWRSR